MDLLKIYYQNARGIKTKLKNFYNNSHTNDYNILCITETWLNDKIDYSKILNNNHSIFRNDITDKEGGGLAKETIYLCNIYIPSYTKANDYLVILEHFESKFIGMLNKNFIILGDFNLPNINWDYPLNLLNSITHKALKEITFINTLFLINFEQFNNIKNHNNRILDLFLSNIDSPKIKIEEFFYLLFLLTNIIHV